jgi:type I restriction enzyme, S subunit
VSTLTLIGAHRAVSSLLETRPDSWGVVRFKGIFDRLDQRNTDLSYEMLSLRSTGEVVARAEMGGRQEPDETSLPKYLVAEVDDLVVNPMWLIGGGIGVSGRAGAVSPDYRVFRSRGSLLPRFIHYLLRSQPYLDQYLLYTRAQTTFDRRVQQPDLDNLPIPVPPLDEQRAIAGYLDRETARIDTLIEEQQRLIEMLRERRADLISHAVLDATSQRTQLRRLVDVIDCAHVTAEFVAGDYRFPVASIRECQGATVDLSVCNYTTAEFFEHLRAGDRAPRAGDLLFIRNVSVGLVSVVAPDLPEFAMGQETVLLRRKSDVHPAFLRYALVGAEARHAIEGAMIGSTFRRINVSAIRSLPVPAPLIDEQRRIAAQLDQQTSKVDTMIAETERFIELSKERRAALITAAVTGQMDVREMA